MNNNKYHGEDYRDHDTPGRRDRDMEQHTVIDRVSNGPRKAMYASVGLLVAIAGLLIGIFVQSFHAGEWKGQTEARIAHSEERADASSLQLEGVIASLQSIVTLDSIQNYQIRQNAATLERVLRELGDHRRASEQ
jgi:hypothetical protein